MRDKLKRRKKSPEETASQPAPLQPAYFEPKQESEPAPEPMQAAVENPADLGDTGSEHGSEAGMDEPAQAEAQSQAGGAGGNDRRPRRRRGRGGRGRKRPGQSFARAAAQQTPSAEAAPAPVPVSQAEPQRASKGTVVLAIGLPGSGKSSWFKRNNINPLSSDMVRAVLFDDPNEQRFQDLVFSNLRSMLRARLIARRPTNYLDATNLTPHDRQSWIKLARDFGYEVQALYFDVPLEVCLERNQKRQRVVQEDVMHKMAAKMKQPTFEEGFSKITVVRVKAKE